MPAAEMHDGPPKDAPKPGLLVPLCPVARPMTEAERDHVMLLIGGLTWKHEELIEPSSVPHGAWAEAIWLHALVAVGWRTVANCELLPGDDLSSD